jgi:hypothetical protein
LPRLRWRARLVSLGGRARQRKLQHCGISAAACCRGISAGRPTATTGPGIRKTRPQRACCNGPRLPGFGSLASTNATISSTDHSLSVMHAAAKFKLRHYPRLSLPLRPAHGRAARQWRRCGLKRQAGGPLPAAHFSARPRNRQAARTANAIPEKRSSGRGPGSPFCLVEQGYGVCGARDERPHAAQQQQLVDQLGHDVLPRSGSGKTTTGSRHFGSATACGPLGFIALMRGDHGSPKLPRLGLSWFEGTQGTAPSARNAPGSTRILCRSASMFAAMLRSLPAGFIAPCLPTKADTLPSGEM